MKYISKKMLLIFSLLFVTTSAFASASSFAVRGDYMGWATGSTQKEADAAALRHCNKTNPKKDCQLMYTKALARAESANGAIGFGRSVKSLAEARKLALDECGEANCKVNFELIKPGFFSLAQTEKAGNNGHSFHLASQFAQSDVANNAALTQCEKNSGRTCIVVIYGVIPGTHSLPIKNATPAVSEKSCRPNTPTVRCSSKCTNGNCLVTYENGCQMRVNVQPRFDGLTNQWVFPSPSC